MKEVLVLAAAGVLVGLPLAIGLSSLVSSQLFGLAPHDPVHTRGIDCRVSNRWPAWQD